MIIFIIFIIIIIIIVIFIYLQALLNFQDARYGITSVKQRHVFGFLFDGADKDKNGSVTLEELKLKMQPAATKHEIKHFVQE